MEIAKVVEKLVKRISGGGGRGRVQIVAEQPQERWGREGGGAESSCTGIGARQGGGAGERVQIVAEQLDKGDEARDFKGIYEECATILYKEIDYIAEGRNADRCDFNPIVFGFFLLSR